MNQFNTKSAQCEIKKESSTQKNNEWRIGSSSYSAWNMMDTNTKQVAVQKSNDENCSAFLKNDFTDINNNVKTNIEAEIRDVCLTSHMAQTMSDDIMSAALQKKDIPEVKETQDDLSEQNTQKQLLKCGTQIDAENELPYEEQVCTLEQPQEQEQIEDLYFKETKAVNTARTVQVILPKQDLTEKTELTTDEKADIEDAFNLNDDKGIEIEAAQTYTEDVLCTKNELQENIDVNINEQDLTYDTNQTCNEVQQSNFNEPVYSEQYEIDVDNIAGYEDEIIQL